MRKQKKRVASSKFMCVSIEPSNVALKNRCCDLEKPSLKPYFNYKSFFLHF